MIRMHLKTRIMIGLFAIFLIACGGENGELKETLEPGVLFCDAEKVDTSGNKFTSYNHSFGGGKGQTSEYAYEGKYSCVVDTTMMYGLSYEFKDLKPNEVFNISVYRKSSDEKGILVAQSFDEKLYKAE